MLTCISVKITILLKYQKLINLKPRKKFDHFHYFSYSFEDHTPMIGSV